MTERPMYQDGYVRIGEHSELDVAIDVSDAYKLRTAVVNELFAPFGAKVLQLASATDENGAMSVSYSAFKGLRTRSIPNVDFLDEPSIFIGAHLREFTDDRWHLRITRTRASRVDEGMSERKLQTAYKLICWGDELVEANRTVKFVKITPLILAIGKTLSENTLSQKPYYKRVGFTAPMQPEDCVTMTELITRHTTRVRHERGILK